MAPIKLSVIAVLAAGKTSAVTILSNMNDNIYLVPEPVSEWQESGILEKYYTDQKKYALEFQLGVIKTRQDAIKQLIRQHSLPEVPTMNVEFKANELILLDGHVQTDRHCFVKTLHEKGTMSSSDVTSYNQVFDNMFNKVPDKDEFFVYLRCKPEICLSRAKQRSRSEESGIVLD